MENPATWNLLTGLLSRCALDQPDAIWERLRPLKVMTEGGRSALASACANLEAQPPGSIGRSGASQIASQLMAAGVVTPRGLKSDAGGRKAEALLRGRRFLWF